MIAVIVGVLAIIGIFYVLLSQAGTTVNYRVADGSIVPRRFPGDPNPKVTGKAYIGGSQLEGTTFKTRFEDPTGKSASLTRRFYGWGSNAKMESDARADIAANRLPFYSTKTAAWTDMASGKYDTQIDDLLKRLDAVGGPVWLVVHHEPDGGCSDSCQGPNKEDDPGGAPAWVNMQKRFRARMNAVGTKNVALMAVLTGGFPETSISKGLTMDSWWADNVWDAYFIDFYKDTHDTAMASHPYWAKFSAWIEKKNNGAGLPYGTAELGNRAGGAKSVGYYQAVPDYDGQNGAGDYNDCVTQQTQKGGLVAAGIPTATVQKSTDMLRDFWNWGFVNKKDVVAHTYFDQCVNSGGSPWALGGQQLDFWRNTLKSDTRVQRINDLGTPTTSTASPTTTTTVTTTPTTTITPSPTPTTGALNISITSPSTTTPLSGSVNVAAGPDTNVQEVSFRLDGAWQTTDSSAPFAWSWDTTKVANGAHTLTIRARRAGDPGDVYTEKSITVTVNNTTTTPTPNPGADITKPSAPTAVKGKVEFDALKLAYFTNLTWSASYDNVGVSRYLISRNGTQIGTSTTASYKDYTLQPNVAYMYEIYAQDAAGNTSVPGVAKLTGRCFLIWCWSE